MDGRPLDVSNHSQLLQLTSAYIGGNNMDSSSASAARAMNDISRLGETLESLGKKYGVLPSSSSVSSASGTPSLPATHPASASYSDFSSSSLVKGMDALLKDVESWKNRMPVQPPAAQSQPIDMSKTHTFPRGSLSSGASAAITPSYADAFEAASELAAVSLDLAAATLSVLPTVSSPRPKTSRGPLNRPMSPSPMQSAPAPISHSSSRPTTPSSRIASAASSRPTTPSRASASAPQQPKRPSSAASRPSSALSNNSDRPQASAVSRPTSAASRASSALVQPYPGYQSRDLSNGRSNSNGRSVSNGRSKTPAKVEPQRPVSRGRGGPAAAAAAASNSRNSLDQKRANSSTRAYMFSDLQRQAALQQQQEAKEMERSRQEKEHRMMMERIRAEEEARQSAVAMAEALRVAADKREEEMVQQEIDDLNRGLEETKRRHREQMMIMQAAMMPSDSSILNSSIPSLSRGSSFTSRSNSASAPQVAPPDLNSILYLSKVRQQLLNVQQPQLQSQPSSASRASSIPSVASSLAATPSLGPSVLISGGASGGPDILQLDVVSAPLNSARQNSASGRQNSAPRSSVITASTVSSLSKINSNRRDRDPSPLSQRRPSSAMSNASSSRSRDPSPVSARGRGRSDSVASSRDPSPASSIRSDRTRATSASRDPSPQTRSVSLLRNSKPNNNNNNNFIDRSHSRERGRASPPSSSISQQLQQQQQQQQQQQKPREPKVVEVRLERLLIESEEYQRVMQDVKEAEQQSVQQSQHQQNMTRIRQEKQLPAWEMTAVPASERLYSIQKDISSRSSVVLAPPSGGIHYAEKDETGKPRATSPMSKKQNKLLQSSLIASSRAAEQEAASSPSLSSVSSISPSSSAAAVPPSQVAKPPPTSFSIIANPIAASASQQQQQQQDTKKRSSPSPSPSPSPSLYSSAREQSALMKQQIIARSSGSSVQPQALDFAQQQPQQQQQQQPPRNVERVSALEGRLQGSVESLFNLQRTYDQEIIILQATLAEKERALKEAQAKITSMERHNSSSSNLNISFTPTSNHSSPSSISPPPSSTPSASSSLPFAVSSSFPSSFAAPPPPPQLASTSLLPSAPALSSNFKQYSHPSYSHSSSALELDDPEGPSDRPLAMPPSASVSAASILEKNFPLSSGTSADLRAEILEDLKKLNHNSGSSTFAAAAAPAVPPAPTRSAPLLALSSLKKSSYDNLSPDVLAVLEKIKQEKRNLNM